MCDKSFRVLLDLTDFQIDSLKYVWINVSPQELLTIADFKSYILRKINFESANIKLYVRKGLLLDSESTTILREDDTVKVHYAKQLISKENSLENCVKENRKSRKRIHAECISESSINANELNKDGKVYENRNNEDEVSKKRKKKKNKPLLHSLEPEASCIQPIVLEANNLQKLETHKKKDKRLTSGKINSDIQICDFFSFNNSECTVLGNKEKSSENTCMKISDFSKSNLSKDTPCIDNVSLEVENESKDQSSLLPVTVEDSNALDTATKKKRKRRRKRKKAHETVSDITDNTNNQSEFKSFLYEANKSYQGKHVTYSSSPSKEEEIIEIDCDDNFKNIKSPNAENFKNIKSPNAENFKNIKSQNAETFVMNASLSNCPVETLFDHPKVSTPAQSSKFEIPNWCVSGMQNPTANSPVYEDDLGLSAANSIQKCRWNSTEVKSYSCLSDELKTKEKQSKKMHYKLIPFTFEPVVGTRIVDKDDLGLSAANSIQKCRRNSTEAKSYSFQSEEIKTKMKESIKQYERICSKLLPSKFEPDAPTRIADKEDLGLSAANSIQKCWISTDSESYSCQSEEFKTKEKQSEKTYSELLPLKFGSDVRTCIDYKKDLGLSAANSIQNSSWNSTHSKSYSKQSEEFKTKEKQSEKTYSELPPLKSMPDVGTHIAYKILELDEHYSPVISDYREGIVISVNSENEEIIIDLVEHVIKPGKTGKFENLREGEVPLPEVRKCDTVKWSSLVEPKLLLC